MQRERCAQPETIPPVRHAVNAADRPRRGAAWVGVAGIGRETALVEQQAHFLTIASSSGVRELPGSGSQWLGIGLFEPAGDRHRGPGQ